MKRKFLNILAASFVITTISLIMDGDTVKPSMLMRFIEFFVMLAIVFSLVSFFYFTSKFVFKNIQRTIN